MICLKRAHLTPLNLSLPFKSAFLGLAALLNIKIESMRLTVLTVRARCLSSPNLSFLLTEITCPYAAFMLIILIFGYV